MSKTLILDYSTWRSGCNSKKGNKLGKGETYLLNSKGYMCCLGQFTPQLNPKIEVKDMLDSGEPDQLNEHIPLLTVDRENPYDTIINSSVAENAILINDDEDTTPDEKIVKLTHLFAAEGYKIKVVNKPKKD